MRARLIDALRDTSPSQVRLLERRETTITPVSTPWLDGWQVVDVLARIVPHPVRFVVAISADDEVVHLTGEPAEFSSVTQQAKLDVSSAKVAVEVAEVYLDSTQDFAKASYRIDSVDDIQWLKTTTAAQAKKQAELERELPKVVEPAKAKASGDGWVVTAWMVYDRQLDKHTVTIGPDGAVSDEVEHAYEGLPVPESI